MNSLNYYVSRNNLSFQTLRDILGQFLGANYTAVSCLPGVGRCALLYLVHFIDLDDLAAERIKRKITNNCKMMLLLLLLLADLSHHLRQVIFKKVSLYVAMKRQK